MKLTLMQVPTFSLAFIRMFFAAAILFALIPSRLKIQKADFASFFWAAITGVTLNISLFFIGLKLSQAINAALLVAAVPILTMLAAHFYLREKLTAKLILASAVATFGVVIIIGKPAGPASITHIIGDILLLLSSLAWVFHEIIAKKLLQKYDDSTVTFYTLGIGGLTFLPLALVEFAKTPGWLSNVTLSGYLGIIYGIFLASLLAYWAWQKGLAKIPAGQASFFFYLDPISGAILAMILLGEKLTPQILIGGLLIAIAVFLAEYSRKSHPLHK